MIFHPIATEQRGLKKQISTLTSALKESKKKYVVIFPNNDMGSEIIIKNYSNLKKNKNQIHKRSLEMLDALEAVCDISPKKVEPIEKGSKTIWIVITVRKG